ncbi:MAG: hypothetical protein WC838_05275 [Candidatus Margulisiibacteriota bacterium]|jgi:hypothetical protein
MVSVNSTTSGTVLPLENNSNIDSDDNVLTTNNSPDPYQSHNLIMNTLLVQDSDGNPPCRCYCCQQGLNPGVISASVPIQAAPVTSNVNETDIINAFDREAQDAQDALKILFQKYAALKQKIIDTYDDETGNYDHDLANQTEELGKKAREIWTAFYQKHDMYPTNALIGELRIHQQSDICYHNNDQSINNGGFFNMNSVNALPCR